MAIITRRPDLKHDDQVRNMTRFMSREDGDTGTVGGREFEVIRVEGVRMPGSVSAVRRLVCSYADDGTEFHIDGHQLHILKPEWD